MVNYRDLGSGSAVAAVGAFFSFNAFQNLAIGTTFRMGPGYFPAAVGLIVAGLGLAIVAAALRGGPAEALPAIRWRPVLLVSAAVLVFLFTVRGAGLIPAVTAVVVAARLADPGSRPIGTLVLAASLSLFCAGVFVLGIGLPIALLGNWWQ